jgi:hypothetical protein
LGTRASGTTRSPAELDGEAAESKSEEFTRTAGGREACDSRLTQPAPKRQNRQSDGKTLLRPHGAPAAQGGSAPGTVGHDVRGSQPPTPPDSAHDAAAGFSGSVPGTVGTANRGAASRNLPALPPVADFPPVDLTDARDTLRPTLFVGIGGTGARVLAHLRRRLHDRFPQAEPVAALRMLLVDTDAKALHRTTQAGDASRFTARETLALPLRRPQDYRGQSKRFLRWLSRRWLYNIPRSLETEGLRPLGRLAFADHAQEVVDRLRGELCALADPESLAASSAATGLPLAPEATVGLSHQAGGGAPRVVVVASISGGTGGGIVLDLAYAARQILGELGQS